MGQLSKGCMLTNPQIQRLINDLETIVATYDYRMAAVMSDFYGAAVTMIRRKDS